MKTIKITLDKKLRSLGITRYELAKRSSVGYQTIDNYYKNRVVRYDKDILLKIFEDSIDFCDEDELSIKFIDD